MELAENSGFEYSQVDYAGHNVHLNNQRCFQTWLSNVSPVVDGHWASLSVSSAIEAKEQHRRDSTLVALSNRTMGITMAKTVSITERRNFTQPLIGAMKAVIWRYLLPCSPVDGIAKITIARPQVHNAVPSTNRKRDDQCTGRCSLWRESWRNHSNGSWWRRSVLVVTKVFVVTTAVTKIVKGTHHLNVLDFQRQIDLVLSQ